jgi:long-chain acyl-CoA synthetase
MQPSARSLAVRTVAELPFVAGSRYGDKPALRFRHGDGWRSQTFEEMATAVRAVACGLIEANVAPGDRVCVLAETCPQWTRAGLAILAAGAVVVPIYPSSSVQECEWVIGNSGARMVICENETQAAKVEQVHSRLPDLASVVIIDAGPGEGVDTLAHLAEVGQGNAADLDRRIEAVQPADASLIIYTSGTTGPPKGCVLTHDNWLTLCAITEELSYLSYDDVVYLFLPLAHVFAQIVQFASLYSGAELVYFGGDPRRVVAELGETRPTFFPSVPRVFEKVYTLFAGAVDPAWLAQAVAAGRTVRRLRAAGEDIPEPLLTTFEQADTALFAKVRAVFGGRIRQALSGAAPISPNVLEFFHAAGVPVLEGYGMTETTGLGTVNTLDHHRLGSVGVASPGTHVRLADDGEILMRGPHVFAGYWRDPSATAEVFVDGWLRTGDIGEMDADGFVKITGRKKDIIITSGGKNIAPANLENELRQSRWIAQAVMFGDQRPYPVALITLDADEIVPWSASRGLSDDVAVLARHPAVRELIQSVVDEVNSHYSQAAQIKRFAILERDLTQSAGELTPTLKVKRSVVRDNHADVLSSLYSAI